MTGKGKDRNLEHPKNHTLGHRVGGVAFLATH